MTFPMSKCASIKCKVSRKLLIFLKFYFLMQINEKDYIM